MLQVAFGLALAFLVTLTFGVGSAFAEDAPANTPTREQLIEYCSSHYCDWPAPPAGGVVEGECAIWVDPPLVVDVRAFNLTANGTPVAFDQTKNYPQDVQGQVDFPLDPALLPHGDVQVEFDATWSLAPEKVAHFGGTVHCSDVPVCPTLDETAPGGCKVPDVPTDIGTPEVVTPVDGPVAPAQEATACVEGSTDPNCLPFTGSDSKPLGFLGAGLFGLGALALGGVRLRKATTR
jgi:hypothetical protein